MTMLISVFTMIFHNGINSAKIVIVCSHKCKNRNVPYVNIEAELH